MIEQLLSMISKWPAFGQGIFFVIVIALLITIVHNVAFYITAWLRGWPKEDSHFKPWNPY